MAAQLWVLFLCTHNSARSQMAEGWLRHLVGDHYAALVISGSFEGDWQRG
jgi:protein-tyrosine-phosphatase